MFDPWIIVPRKDVIIHKELYDYHILFRDVATIDRVIELLTNLKEIMVEKEKSHK